MSNDAQGTPGRAKQCTYCDRTFSRSEHLSRHERSHRNERPYRCVSCNSTFGRQDTYKRHRSRYHDLSMVAGVAQQNPDSLLQVSSLEVMPEESGDKWHTVNPLQLSNNDFHYNDPMDLFSGSSIFDAPFTTISDIESFAGAAGRLLDEPTPPSPIHKAAIIEPAQWEGSFALSNEKYCQILSEIDMVRPIPVGFQTPSRLKFETLLRTFAECFLVYIPCIHMATWKAEDAFPSLILAMTSIGACYQDDEITSSHLYTVAKASINNYIASSQLSMASEPICVLQCLLLVMVNGSKSASFHNYQEATSLASLLIEGVRYRKPPCVPLRRAKGDDALMEQWQMWIETETVTRTVSAIFVGLNALGINFQATNGLSNLDMSHYHLPCEESEWASSTPQAWLESRQTNSKPPVTFSTALAAMSVPGGATRSPQLSLFGLYVTLHGIVRQLLSLYQEVWLLATTPTVVQRFDQALESWKSCFEQSPEAHISSRYPNGVLATNAIALYRQTYVRLFADFGPLRSAFATRDVQTILASMKQTEIMLTVSTTCLKAAECAVEALQTSVKMGLLQTSSIFGWHRKLLFNLHSIEGCLFLCAWLRHQSTLSVLNRSQKENDLVDLAQETLAEVSLDMAISSKPFSTRLVYAWALIFRSCNASGLHGLHGVIADALDAYAESLASHKPGAVD